MEGLWDHQGSAARQNTGCRTRSSAMASTERVRKHLLDRIDTTWTLSSQRAAREIWAYSRGTDPALKSEQGGSGDALKAEGDGVMMV